MYFLLQSGDNNFRDIDMYLIGECIGKSNRLHNVLSVVFSNIDSVIDTYDIPIKEVIPVGSLEFVSYFLKRVHNVDKMNCIEVPKQFRSYRYLKRDYRILPKDCLPSSGYYFLKYASELKDFTYVGDIQYLSDTYVDGEPYLKDGLYVLSEVVDILSEYRCFILDGKIEGIQFYDGDCTIMPTPDDISLLKEMVSEYSLDVDSPRAYTMDIAIVRGRGLSLLEVHPHVSVGLYGFNSIDLAYHYAYGFDWYVSKNNELGV